MHSRDKVKFSFHSLEFLSETSRSRNADKMGLSMWSACTWTGNVYADWVLAIPQGRGSFESKISVLYPLERPEKKTNQMFPCDITKTALAVEICFFSIRVYYGKRIRILNTRSRNFWRRMQRGQKCGTWKKFHIILFINV